MPEMSSRLNLVEAVKLESLELILIQFAVGCTNVGILPLLQCFKVKPCSEYLSNMRKCRYSLRFYSVLNFPYNGFLTNMILQQFRHTSG